MPVEKTPAERKKDNRRQRILKIALDAFLEQGYANTSMSTIASLVGGSKGTLYNHVKTKEELFVACVEDFIASHARQTFSAIEEGGPPREVLTKFCRYFITAIMSPTDLALSRLVMAESVRFPAIGKAFFASGPQEGRRRLAAYIGTAMDDGLLRKGDPLRAAQLLFSLCESTTYQEVLFNVARPPGRKKIASEAELAVATFFSVHGL